VLDGRHHLELAQAQMPGIGTAPGGAMLTKDVGDLQPAPSTWWALPRLRQQIGVSSRVESGCGAVAVGWACLFPPLSSGGALVAQP
jgi:hypothetical protein